MANCTAETVNRFLGRAFSNLDAICIATNRHRIPHAPNEPLSFHRIVRSFVTTREILVSDRYTNFCVPVNCNER